MIGRISIFLSLFALSMGFVLSDLSYIRIIGYSLLIVILILIIMFVVGLRRFCNYNVTWDYERGELKTIQRDGKEMPASPYVIKFDISPWTPRLLLGYKPSLGYVTAEVAYQYGADTSYTPWSKAIWDVTGSSLIVVDGPMKAALEILDGIDKSFQGVVTVHLRFTQLNGNKITKEDLTI